MFGDVTADASGQLLPHAHVIRNVVDDMGETASPVHPVKTFG
jgi:hypothetical protein